MEKTDDFQSQFCPLCGVKAANFHKADGVPYFDCSACDFIFADTALLAAIDRGETLRKYDRDYWTMELPAARERSFGPALIRAAEAILYARRNIKSFLDIGSGPGYLLDALAFYLPNNSSLFYGIETHPPPPRYRSKHPNYLVGDLKSLATRGFRFQAGVCIEVIEHLTPNMLKKLAADLAKISDEQSLYIFNTGLTAYVKNGNIGYLDPVRRGHICSWSIRAAAKIFGPQGFTVTPIQGRTWVFAVEYRQSETCLDICDRNWMPKKKNKSILHDPQTGSLLYYAGLDAGLYAALAYQVDELLNSTSWRITLPLRKASTAVRHAVHRWRRA